MKNKLVSIVVITRNRRRDLTGCLKSLLKQSYRPLEIVVVDNASDSDQTKWVSKHFPKVKAIRSDVNLGGAGGRNLGTKYVIGDYVLFVDDDAVADSHMVNELVKSLAHKKVGIVQPKIYDKDKARTFQGLGHGVNMLTGKVYGIAIREIDHGQYPCDFEIPMAGCCWMVKREVLTAIGGYDEDYFIPYEDTDFSMRASKAGFKIVLSAHAKVWHQGPKVTAQHPRLQWLGITTPDKAYRLTRNKIIFMTKFANPINLLIFISIFVPLYTVTHIVVIASTGELNLLPGYLKGVASGLNYLITKRLL